MTRTHKALRVSCLNSENIDIKEEINSNGALANIDRNMTIQVFENLVSNAIKFSPKGSTVSLLVKDKIDKLEIGDQSSPIVAQIGGHIVPN